MDRALQQGLSEGEIARLASASTPTRAPGALSLGETDGLFCALIAAPGLVMPGNYLPLILVEFPKNGAFPESADAQHTMSLELRERRPT